MEVNPENDYGRILSRNDEKCTRNSRKRRTWIKVPQNSSPQKEFFVVYWSRSLMLLCKWKFGRFVLLLFARTFCRVGQESVFVAADVPDHRLCCRGASETFSEWALRHQSRFHIHVYLHLSDRPVWAGYCLRSNWRTWAWHRLLAERILSCGCGSSPIQGYTSIGGNWFQCLISGNNNILDHPERTLPGQGW